MSDIYGPSLPPGFARAQPDEAEKEDGHSIVPALPNEQREARGDERTPERVIGPRVPGLNTESAGPEFPESSHTASQHRNTAPKDVYGPALPPDVDCTHTSEAESMQNISKSETEYWPQMCATVGDYKDGSAVLRDEEKTEVNLEEEEEEEEACVIGPLPMAHLRKEELERERRIAEVESRAKSMKDRLSGKDKEPEGAKREVWMTELPVQVKAFGLGPRKFRTRDLETGDRSGWTDTPADKLRKAQETAAAVGKERPRAEVKETTTTFVSARDEKLAAQVTDHNKEHRSKSLIELHRKRRTEEEDSSEKLRRPFDRERDLQLPQNRITPAKRQALMKDSASSLKSKFSHGTQKFL